MSNAIKFTEKGEVVLRIDLAGTKDDKITLKFSIIDSGIGMTEEQVERLFESFRQADTSTTRKYGGTGLGLTISKQLTEMMGGEIHAESQLGIGSQFIFTAVFGINDNLETVLPPPSIDIQGMRVLVVDDSAVAREIIQQLAESFSFEVECASNGKEAIEIVRQADQADRPFKVIFIDWKMPEMDGIEASRIIKMDSSLSVAPKVVMISAYDEDDMLHQAAGLEIEGFLTKPVSPSSLLDATMVALGYEAAPGKQNIKSGLGLDVVSNILGARILLVEDNEINQQVATELLELAQMAVTIANNGREAVDLINMAQVPFDCVLMDVQMPVMDGYEATRTIRQNAACADLPIVAMTANASLSDRNEAFEVGMNDYVAKPINPKDMYKALAKWVKPCEREIPDHLKSSQREASPKDALLRLPGFKVEQALARTGGNVQSYRKLLSMFVTNQAEASSAIIKALDDGDGESAVRIAHTLRGVAGTIGAMDLQAAALLAEQALAEKGNPRPDALLSQLEDALIATLDIIKGALPPKDKAAAPIEAVGLEELSPKFTSLQSMLDSYDSEAEDMLDDIVGKMGDATLREALIKLQKLVQDFDFEGASTELLKISADFDISMVGKRS